MSNVSLLACPLLLAQGTGVAVVGCADQILYTQPRLPKIFLIPQRLLG